MSIKILQTLIGGIVAVILAVTLSLISFRVIDAYCDLGEKITDGAASHEYLTTQMQDLKDWGGLVLGFFFGAGFNFISIMLISQRANKKEAGAPEDSTPNQPTGGNG